MTFLLRKSGWPTFPGLPMLRRAAIQLWLTVISFCSKAAISTFRRSLPGSSFKSASLNPVAATGENRAGTGSSGEKKWAPLRKTFYSLGAVAEAMSACNRRYLACISQWTDRTRERHALREITASRRDEKERSVRGVNFFRDDDLLFLRALERGEHQIAGLRNRTLQPHLPGWKPAKIGRNLRLFRVLRLIKRVRGTRRYYPTLRGQSSSSQPSNSSNASSYLLSLPDIIVENVFALSKRGTKCRRKKLYGQIRRELGRIFRELARQKESKVEHFSARGYWVSTVGKNEAAVRRYIQEQEREDRRLEQMELTAL